MLVFYRRYSHSKTTSTQIYILSTNLAVTAFCNWSLLSGPFDGINIEISFPVDQRFGGMLTSLDSGVSLKPAPPSPAHPNPCPFSQAGQWGTYYLPCRTGNAIVRHMNSPGTLSSFIEGIILNLLILSEQTERYI